MNLKGKLNGISLFAGCAGIDLALEEYVKSILYCEIEEFAQAILISRMDDGSIPFAPIWNDVTTLDGAKFRGLADIVLGGFPCQDISVAGNGKGLDGKRSGLFFEFLRVLRESEAPFAFFENVPAIRTRGAIEIQEALASIGYAAIWGHISAAEVGANHRRERWFCLAYSDSKGPQRHGMSGRISQKIPVIVSTGDEVAYSDMQGLGRETASGQKKDNEGVWQGNGRPMPPALNCSWWQVEPDVGRVANGVADRAHRIKALGNGVVPLQVKTAFEMLMGINKSSEVV